MDKELEVRLQFLEEAQEYLDTLEAVVLGLSVAGVDPKKIDGALRAAHSIKGGAALMQFHLLSQTAHRLEDVFKILAARRPEVGEELENLLLSSLDSMRQIIELSRGGKDPDEDKMAQPASPIFDQLQDILGELQPEDETTLASQESGQDLVKLFFETEVEQSLLRLEEVLSQPDQPCLESEITVLAQELGGLGEMLQLSNFSSLCQSISQYLETYPGQAAQIATLALGKWRQSQALVLIGQADLMPIALDYHPPATPETSEPNPELANTHQSELELLLAGLDLEPLAPMGSLPSTPDVKADAQSELTLEQWPELEALLSEFKPEETTPKVTEPSPVQTEAGLGLEALLMGLDLDLFQEVEAAPPAQPLAEVISENEWADLDSLFSELERETPTLQKEAEPARIEPSPVAPELVKLVTPAPEMEAIPTVQAEVLELSTELKAPSETVVQVTPEVLTESVEIEAPELFQVEAQTDAAPVEAASVPLEVLAIEPEPQATPQEIIHLAAKTDVHEGTSEFSEDTGETFMGLGMLGAIFDVGIEPAKSEPIVLAEKETHSEIDTVEFLHESSVEAASVPLEVPAIDPEPQAAPQEIIHLAAKTDAHEEISEFSEETGETFMGLGMLGAIFDVGIAPTQSEPIVLAEEETHSEVEAHFLEVFDIEAAEPTVQPELAISPNLGITSGHEIVEDLVAEEPEQLSSDDQATQWSEIGSFVAVSKPALEAEQTALLSEATVSAASTQQAVSEAPVHVISLESHPLDIIAEHKIIEEPATDSAQLILLPAVSEDSLEYCSLEHTAETVPIPEHQEASAFEVEPPILLSASTEVSLEPHALDIVAEHEIVKEPIAETAHDAEQPADASLIQWSEIAAFVGGAAIAGTVFHETETHPAPKAENETPLELQQVQEDVAAEHEFLKEPVAETVLEPEHQEVFEIKAEQPTLLSEASVSAASTQQAVSEAPVHVISLEPHPLRAIAEHEAEHEIVEELAIEPVVDSEHPLAAQLPAWSPVAFSPAITESEPFQDLVAAQEQPIIFATPGLPELPIPAIASQQTEPSPVVEKSILSKKLESASSRSTEANTVRIPAKRLDQLDDLCGDLTIERNGLALYLGRLHNLVSGLNTRIRDLEQFNLRLRSAYDQEASQANNTMLGGQPSATEENFDVLEMDRYSELHLVWQEVMESIVQIQEVTSDIDLTVRNADDTAAELNRTAKQLQSNVMYSRMRPLSDVVGRFPRAIRDLSQQFGKLATLKIQGGSTLIDRTVLGILGDPLMHLLRNAFDHGLEDTDTRAARGKPAQGTIEIQAFYRGNETIITVSDDGGGISLDKIRDKAQRMGFDQAQLEKARPQDLLDLIFEPGFSTAEKVTELSGRGVGMDVVRTNLQQVRGKITVNTQPGVGTTFTLSVPVTLSVGRVLLVESQNVMLAFPVDAIEQMALLEEEEGNDSNIFQWENYAVPKLSLRAWLDFRCPFRKIETDDLVTMANPAILILSQGNDLIGVQIDRCWGEREVAIRQAEGPISMPPGFSGCTILGTGQVVPLVSIPGLFTWIADQERLPKTEVPSAVSHSQNERETILVIDDSINVRRFLALTLEKAGYRVSQAKDGQDAIEQLTSGLVVNAVICDIEMPRLDGFGFLAQVKANPALKQLPITMLTSRSGDKHRQLALRLGASEYFSKPFKEQELLEALKRLTQSKQLTPLS